MTSARYVVAMALMPVAMMPLNGGEAAHSPAGALAAPHLIVFAASSSGPTARLEQWSENSELLAAIVPTALPTLERLDGRPAHDFGMFWGTATSQRLAAGIPKRNWAIELAETRGTYYPAIGSAPALLVFKRGWQGAAANQLTADGLAILRRYKISG